MYVAPAKAKRDRRTDDGQSDPYVALCFAGATIITKSLFHDLFLKLVHLL